MGATGRRGKGKVMKKNGLMGTGLWALARRGIALAMLCVIAPSWAADDFLPPQQAYKYTARIENDQLIVSWNIEKGYYLRSPALVTCDFVTDPRTPAHP